MNKHKIIYILISFAVLLFTGCSKDTLEKKPLDSFSEVDVFSDAALLKLYVLGTYRGMGHPFGGEGNNFSEGYTDNAYAQHSGTAKTFTQGEINSSNGEGVTNGAWNDAYFNIRRVNVYFEKTATSTIDAATLKTLSAEMRFIRAYLYYKLVKWYGGVPVITASVPLGLDDYGVPRNTADEVFDFIVSECNLAMADLPDFAAAEKGRASKEAAMALKGRTLLYAASPLWNTTNDQAKWTAAKDANKAAMDITSVSLLSDPARYHEIFNGKNSEEVIMARYFTPSNPHGGGEWGVNLWLYPNGLNGWGNMVPTQDLVDCYELTNGKLPADAGSGYDPQDPYTNRDPRFSESILYNTAMFFDPNNKVVRPMEYWRDKNDPTNSALAGKESRNSSIEPWNASKTGYNFRKYTDEGKPAYGDKGANENISPWIYFRKSECYLNYAECEIALGNEQPARDAINAVRGRVGMPAITETGDALLARYRNERRVEFAFEDLRIDDMRRWKIGPDALNKAAKGVDVYNNGGIMEYNYDYNADINRKWLDKMYLLPIPFSEIQSSGGKLTQNPGYE